MKTGPIVHMPAICFGRQICVNFIFILFVLKSSMSEISIEIIWYICPNRLAPIYIMGATKKSIYTESNYHSISHHYI